MKKYSIRFHNKVAWMYPYIVEQMIKQSYIWNDDLWGYKPKHDGSHLGFKTKDVYDAAIKIKRCLEGLK